ncbi:MAG: transposase [Anaerolineae bacterium]|nr:transposase [Anaerolineae bacterium]
MEYHNQREVIKHGKMSRLRLHIVWLPTYSPYFNPIERFWLYLKNLASANHLHTGLADLSAAIDHTIAAHNDVSSPDRLSFAHYFRLTA